MGKERLTAGTGLVASVIFLLGAAPAPAQQCQPLAASCANPTIGVGRDTACCSLCCETLLPSLGGRCVDAANCGPIPPPTPRATPTPPPTPDALGFVEIDRCGSVSQDVRLAGDLATEANVCLVVKEPGIVIDGGDRGDGSPWTIRAAKYAIVNGQDGVTIQNVVTNAGILVRDADFNTIRNVRTGRINALGARDLLIEDSHMTSLAIARLDDTILSQRALVRRNTIEGAVGDRFKLETGVREVNLLSEDCLEGNHRVYDNTIVHTGPAYTGVFLRCSTHNEFVGNTIVGAPMLMRDEADFNLIQGNTIWTRSDARALSITSGNLRHGHPRGNTVDGNVFVAEEKPPLRLQAAEASDNVFRGNLFVWGGDEAIEIRSPLGNVFDHNTFSRRHGGPLLVVSDVNRGDVTTPNRYTSNIFDYGGGVALWIGGDSEDLRGFQGDHNVYFDHADPQGTVQIAAPHARILSFEEWRTESGADRSSIVGNPDFCDPANEDFHPRATSAARGTGEDGSDAGALSFDPSRACPPPTPTPEVVSVATPTPAPACLPEGSICSGPVAPGAFGPSPSDCCSGCCFVGVTSLFGSCAPASSCR